MVIEIVIYINNVLDILDFFWFFLDQNCFCLDSMVNVIVIVGNGVLEGIFVYGMWCCQMIEDNGYGFNIMAVIDVNGEVMDYIIVDMLMCIDFDDVLEIGDSVMFMIEWNYCLIEVFCVGGWVGKECFEVIDDMGVDCIFQVVQWFLCVVVFFDYEGWYNKVFLGVGEFGFEFGDYNVFIIVFQDFIVVVMGEFINGEDVLIQVQCDCFEEVCMVDELVFIVIFVEVCVNECCGMWFEVMWEFFVVNVCDFVFVVLCKFIWDV